MSIKKAVFTILFVFAIASAKAQKNSYAYEDTSFLALLDNTEWLRQAAKKFIADTSTQRTIGSYLDLCVLLDKTEEAELLLRDSADAIRHLYFGSAVFPAVMHSYFTARERNDPSAYYVEMKRYFPSLNSSANDKRSIGKQRSDFIPSRSTFLMYTTDSIELINSIMKYGFPTGLNRPEKTFTETEIIYILSGAALRKLGKYILPWQDRFANELEQESYDEAMKYWSNVQYQYASSDQPRTVIAANMQCFDRAPFADSQIWKNGREIPGNGIDDDANGIVDDIYGIIFDNKVPNKPMPIFLDRTKDIQYFSDGIVNHEHGTMTVELMLKDNPTAKIMGLEHQRYDPVWKQIQKKFSPDTVRNQQMVDSVIMERLSVWQRLVDYLRENQVRVAEINSMGFMLDGDEFILTGCCGNEAETRKYKAEKFRQLVRGFEKIFASSPNTLFVLAGGNDNSNSSVNPDLSNQIHAPNTVIVGALAQDLYRANYSNFGKDIDVYAPAHFKLTSPNTYVESNGTSAASPVVCNLAIKLFSLCPTLTPAQVKKLIVDNSDYDLKEKGINVINPKRTIEAMKTQLAAGDFIR